MMFNVKIEIFGKEFNLKNIEAQNEFEAENKAKLIVNKRLTFKAEIKEKEKFDSDFFDFFNIKK